MNPPVNRPSESPRRASQPSPASLSSSPGGSAGRQVPIPPPSHPRQYRAIGLIKGQYVGSEEHINRGVLVTSGGTVIDAVLLGRVLSVIKNHLDLDKPHLWVVYPRTRKTNDQLQVQIVGVWEPETLTQDLPPNPVPTQPQDPSLSSLTPLTLPIEDGYFSIRGEAIFASHDRETVIIKIRQSPKKPSEKPKFFKVKLKGILGNQPIGHFWDIQAQLQKDILVIQNATDLGFIPKKKPFSKFNKQKSKRPFIPRDQWQVEGSDRPVFPRRSSDIPKPAPRKKPLPKPIKGKRPENE